jgi:hypothetical protein
MNESVHVFSGRFASNEEALAYTEARWEDEPDESVSDEEYEAWEARHPVWPMRTDLDAYLDSDFIETVTGSDRDGYLGKILVNPDDLQLITSASPDADTLILIFKEALGGFEATMKSTPRMTYCGEFHCDLTGL